MDFHILLTFLQRGWGIVAGVVTLLLIPHWFGPVEQGYYYTFASLIGLQVFFELGLNSVIVQMVGHEFAHLRYNATGQLEGPVRHAERLWSLLGMLRKWYRVAALLFLLCIVPAGWFFFSRHGELPLHSWLGPWALLGLFTSINLMLSPLLAVAEGCGAVGQVARLRLIQSMGGYLLMWASLSFGAHLWAIPLLAATSAAVTLVWARDERGLVGRLLRREAPDAGSPHVISWRHEILPLQWRTALSWMSGYFIFSLFTPVIFAAQGPVAAGAVGMALALFSSLLALGMSWVSARAPVFAAHIARAERPQLNAVFRSAAYRSAAFTTAACLGVSLVIGLMQQAGLPIARRIAEAPILVCLSVATIANTVIAAAATYMRAHKEEPMLGNSVCVALLIGAAIYVAAAHSVFWTMFSYMLVVLLVALPWTLVLFRGYYGRVR